jgi:hypothetical protein
MAAKLILAFSGISFLVATIEPVEVVWVAFAVVLLVLHVFALLHAIASRHDLEEAVRIGLVHRGARSLIAAGAIRRELKRLTVQLAFLAAGVAQFYRPAEPSGAPDEFAWIRLVTIALFFLAQIATAIDAGLDVRDRRRLVDYYSARGRMNLVELAEDRAAEDLVAENVERERGRE